jgi:hypothetical protein
LTYKDRQECEGESQNTTETNRAVTENDFELPQEVEERGVIRKRIEKPGKMEVTNESNA